MAQKKSTTKDQDTETVSQEPATAETTTNEEKPLARTKKATVSTNVKRKEALVYIGPNLPGGILFKSTVFRAGELPPHIQPKLDECPALKFLFVTPARLAKARARLSETSSIEASKYAEVMTHFYKGAN